MRIILISIKPEYAEKIFNGNKKFEFRKRIPSKEVDAIVFYVTSPERAIVGEARVSKSIAMSPSALWDKTKKQAGITRKAYRDYFSNCKKAYAFELNHIIAYKEAKNLEFISINNAPQSFIYLSDVQYKCLKEGE